MSNQLQNKLVLITTILLLGSVMAVFTYVAFTNQAPVKKNIEETSSKKTIKKTIKEPIKEAHATKPDVNDLKTSQTKPQDCLPAPKAKKPKTNHTQAKTLSLKLGKTIEVYNIVNLMNPPKELTPIYNDQGEFDAVAIHQFDRQGNKKLMSITALKKSNQHFPPITLEQARNVLKQYNHQENYVYQGKFVSFINETVPFYLFKNDNEKIYLVDAYTGFIDVINQDILKQEKIKQQIEHVGGVVSVNPEGLLIIHPKIKGSLSKTEIELLELENKHTNALIQKGIVKINAYGHIIEDNRTEADWMALEKSMSHLIKKQLNNDADINNVKDDSYISGMIGSYTKPDDPKQD